MSRLTLCKIRLPSIIRSIAFAIVATAHVPGRAEDCGSLLLQVDPIMSRLANDTVSDGGVLPTFIPHPITMSSGIKAVWRMRNPKYEVAAFELSKILGLDLVPPTVFRSIDGNTGALQLFVKGREGGEFSAEALFFDFIVQEGDRHSGNFLLSAENKVVLFDHEKSFRSTDVSTETLQHQLLVAKERYREFKEGGYAVKGLRESTRKRLMEIPDRLVEKELAKWLSQAEIKAVLVRKKYFLEHLDEIFRR